MLIRNYSETQPHAPPRPRPGEYVYRPSPVWIWYV